MIESEKIPADQKPSGGTSYADFMNACTVREMEVGRSAQVLRKCFTAREWELLMQDGSFAEATVRVETLDDVEAMSTFGGRILDDQNDWERPQDKRGSSCRSV